MLVKPPLPLLSQTPLHSQAGGIQHGGPHQLNGGHHLADIVIADQAA